MTLANTTHRRSRSTRGFTMIELVIGIAVLAILGGVAVAGYGFIRSDAAERAMVNDLKAIGPAMERHFNEYNQYPTSIATSGTPTATSLVFGSSPGVSLAFVGTPAETSYTVSSTHSKRSGWRCEITVQSFGSATPVCSAATS
ncbi:MAG: prepilin-type N-terminal cleavage/methylation domain-containing protein [Gemmatimonadota bacterium]|nr:prepilin-type N-terminal cleavage/methylation domain-containing protein [Gemmatimonadota bacterium]